MNDASTDDTYSKLLEYEKMYPESILVINCTENMRQGGARNIALEYITGEYLAFVDSDDCIDARAYEELYKLAVENDFDIIQFNHYLSNGNQKKIIENATEMKIIDLEDIETRKEFLTKELMTYGCWNKLYRTALVKKVDSKYAEHCVYEEPPFVYPLFFFAKKVCCIPEAYYYYFMNQKGTIHNYMKQYGRLLDHSKAQKFLLQEMKSFPEILKTYHDEIELYFLHTFYFETLIFAGERNLLLPASDFREIQSYALSQFSAWKSNKYINKMPFLKQVLNTMRIEMNQKQLDSLCMQIQSIIAKSEK